MNKKFYTIEDLKSGLEFTGKFEKNWLEDSGNRYETQAEAETDFSVALENSGYLEPKILEHSPISDNDGEILEWSIKIIK